MSDVEALKAEIKKFSARATAAKMNLHDFSEELPVNWADAPKFAEAVVEAYAALDAARKKLKELEQA
jgi:hypothetical protein